MKQKLPSGKHTLDQCYSALKQAAENNTPGLFADEYYLLGLAFDEGLFGVIQNHQLAVEYIKRAADMGHPLACFYMGMELSDLNSDKPASPEAVAYYVKAASQGEVRAKLHQAILMITGAVNEPYEGAVMELLEQAALHVEPSAMGMLGFYLQEQMESKPGIAALARFYAAGALRFGNGEVVSDHLDMFFTEADCNAKGEIEIERIISEAADGGNALAQYLKYELLVSDDDGKFKGDTDESLALLRKAAVGGVPEAMEREALYRLQKGAADATELLQAAVEQKMPEAMLAMGVIKSKDAAKPIDTSSEAAMLILDALAFGLPIARMTMSQMTEDGLFADPYGCRSDFYCYAALDAEDQESDE